MDDENYKRKVALERAEILKDKVNDYIINKDKIPRGMSELQEGKILHKKNRILSLLNATEDNWNDWKWQVKNRINSVKLLTQITNLKIYPFKGIGEIKF